jgi:hypothetical protein
MNLITKIILIIAGVLVISAMGFIIYQQIEMHNMQTAINQSVIAQKQLADQIVRSQSSYVSKDDLNNFAKQNDINLNTINKDLSTLGAVITGINHVSVNSGGTIETNIGSTSTTPDTHPSTVPIVNCNGTQIPCTNADPFGYMSNVQHLELNEQFTGATVPVGNVSFDASSKTPWSEDIYPRTYSVNSVLGTTTDGKHVVYNTMQITSNGKTVPINVSTGKFEETYPAPSFSFWNPRLFGTGGASVNLSKIGGSADVGLTLGIMSYGTTKVSPAISVLQLGVGYQTGTQKVSGILNPVSFNISGILPKGIVDNTYIGPSFQMDTSGHIFGGANISVGF